MIWRLLSSYDKLVEERKNARMMPFVCLRCLRQREDRRMTTHPAPSTTSKTAEFHREMRNICCFDKCHAVRRRFVRNIPVICQRRVVFAAMECSTSRCTSFPMSSKRTSSFSECNNRRRASSSSSFRRPNDGGRRTRASSLYSECPQEFGC